MGDAIPDSHNRKSIGQFLSEKSRQKEALEAYRDAKDNRDAMAVELDHANRVARRTLGRKRDATRGDGCGLIGILDDLEREVLKLRAEADVDSEWRRARLRRLC
jgi:hypothetical protein